MLENCIVQLSEYLYFKCPVYMMCSKMFGAVYAVVICRFFLQVHRVSRLEVLPSHPLKGLKDLCTIGRSTFTSPLCFTFTAQPPPPACLHLRTVALMPPCPTTPIEYSHPNTACIMSTKFCVPKSSRDRLAPETMW